MTLQTRRSTGLSPLAIVLPRPPLPRRSLSKSSLLSSSDPHTPRSSSLSNLHAIYYPSSNRKSSDSWNSSNADEMEFDWLPDQVLFLSRTLDALPAHLITPFHGPVPPSNLLDKIARSVSHAKGTTDWPHSIRATRVKLLELARTKAKEEKEKARERNIHLVIREEVEVDDDIQMGADIGRPRPIYRQSSMDFIDNRPGDIKDNAAIARLSMRLQRTDRILSYQYHPYSRPKGSVNDSHIPGSGQGLKHRRSSSPPHSSDVPSLTDPSSASSSTINSLSSASSSAIPRGLKLRRSTSTMSSISLRDSSDGALVDPRVQRLKRSESHAEPLAASAPLPPPKDRYVPRVSLKRAPTFGVLKQEAKMERQRKQDAAHTSIPLAPAATGAKKSCHERKVSTESHISSDEEEVVRNKNVKKLRTNASKHSPPPVSSSPTLTSSSSPAVGRRSTTAPPKTQPEKRLLSLHGLRSMTSKLTAGTRLSQSPGNGDDAMKVINAPNTNAIANQKSNSSSNRTLSRPGNLQRKPSMFGEELPRISSPEQRFPDPEPKILGACGKTKSDETTSKKDRLRSPESLSRLASRSVPKSSTLSPESPATRTLRRVRRLDLGLGLGARKIEFGSLGGEEHKKAGSAQGLEGAIQLM